jgi:uncharacterized protein (DUF779 family)
MTEFAIRRVSATPAALELIEELTELHGPVAFFQADGCLDGAVAFCRTKAELLPGPDDLKLGEIGGAPFYVDAELYAGWGRPVFVIDVAAGAAGSLPLRGLEELHFVSRSPYGAGVTA